jgi:hypothetical protein
MSTATTEHYDGRVSQGLLEKALRGISIWRIVCLAVLFVALALGLSNFLLGVEVAQQQQIIEQLREKCRTLQKDAEIVPQLPASHIRIRREML